MYECTLRVGDKFKGAEPLLLHDIDMYVYTHAHLLSKADAYYSLTPPQQQQLSNSL